MDFSEALRKLKEGKRITNLGWNGKGMYIFLQPGYPGGVPANKNTAEGAGIEEGEIIYVNPYIMMVGADGSFVPWLASQYDLFSNAWDVMEE